MWLISQSDNVTAEELAEYEHVFVASHSYLKQLQSAGLSASLLLQCTDATKFRPAEKKNAGSVLFVGNLRDKLERPIVKSAIDAGFDVEVWGKGWKGRIPDANYRGLHVDNDDLPKKYGAASVVLNDHTVSMREDGFLNNRVYDAAACATPVVTETMGGIPSSFEQFLHLYRSIEEVPRAIGDAMSATNTKALFAFAEMVRTEHSFDNRAATILSHVS